MGIEVKVSWDMGTDEIHEGTLEVGQESVRRQWKGKVSSCGVDGEAAGPGTYR